MITTTHICEIEIGDEYIEVEFDCELHSENDGIGSYEFWGSKCYDAGNDYLVLDEMKWDKASFNEEQNKVIEKYLDDNWESLDETITQKLYDEGYGDDYYED
jgi:hypothetical protein